MNAKNTTQKRTAKTITESTEVPTAPKWCLDRRCRRMNQKVIRAAIAAEISAACQESKEFKTLSISLILYPSHRRRRRAPLRPKSTVDTVGIK